MLSLNRFLPKNQILLTSFEDNDHIKICCFFFLLNNHFKLSVYEIWPLVCQHVLIRSSMCTVHPHVWSSSLGLWLILCFWASTFISSLSSLCLSFFLSFCFLRIRWLWWVSYSLNLIIMASLSSSLHPTVVCCSGNFVSLLIQWSFSPCIISFA